MVVTVSYTRDSLSKNDLSHNIRHKENRKKSFGIVNQA